MQLLQGGFYLLLIGDCIMLSVMLEKAVTCLPPTPHPQPHPTSFLGDNKEASSIIQGAAMGRFNLEFLRARLCGIEP